MEERINNRFVLKKLRPSHFSSDTNEQIHSLFEQLNASITQLQAIEVTKTDETIFMACWYENRIVGMAIMATYKVISGHKGIIEDVVVNEKFRGNGIGKRLVQMLLEEARKLHLSEILLFSGHHRKAAIHLYKSLGFKLKDSGLYHLQLNEVIAP